MEEASRGVPAARQHGDPGLGAVSRHDDVRARGRRADEPQARRPLPRDGRQLRRHRRRVRRRASRRRSRDVRCKAGGTTSCWRPRSGSPPARASTTRRLASPHPHGRSRRRSAASGPSGSTCTKSTAGTRARRSRRRLSTLDDLVHEGKIRYTGASNYTAWQLAKSLGLAAGRGLGRVRVAPARVLPDHARHRARAAPPVPRRGAGGAPLEPARRGRADREVPRRRGLPEGDAGRRHGGADHVHVPAARAGLGHRRGGAQGRRRARARRRRRCR